jgi:hypothetical protein
MNDTFVVRFFRAVSAPATLHVASRTLQELQTGVTLNTAPQMSATGSGESNAGHAQYCADGHSTTLLSCVPRYPLMKMLRANKN